MRYYHTILLILLVLLGSSCKDNDPTVEPQQPIDDGPILFTPAKQAALLDLSARSGDLQDTDRQLYSARHMLDIAGIPYFETQTLTEALQGSLILISSPLTAQHLTTGEADTLQAWVKKGGVIISPACTHPSLAPLFGYADCLYKKDRHRITWAEGNQPELVYFDQPEEKTISLGRESYGEIIKSYGYTISDGETLATFDNGETAVVRKQTEKGKTYLFGVEWRDVIQRSQLNKDFEAQRTYSNGFEPSGDVFPLFIRSVWNELNPISVWKHTIPKGYRTVLIPTHDADSKTAYDAMHYMSTYEKNLGLKGHYFITTHYFNDDLMSPFYNENSVARIKDLLADGHTVGSHSVGHFPDFSSDALFPKGSGNETKENYQPFYSDLFQATKGGTTYGEVAVSKQLLENEAGAKIRSYRTGHLCTNSYLAETVEECGYDFSSCFSAGDVLTTFPFFERHMYKWEGKLSTVLQMPLHISDVFASDPITRDNYPDKARQWAQVLDCLKGNYSPCIILIHPNRKWKMQALELLVKQMNRSECGLYNFEEFGDFWINRGHFNFTFGFSEEDGALTICAPKEQILKNTSLGLMVETTRPVKLCRLIDTDFNRYPVSVTRISDTRRLVVINK